ncbi:MAG TPA: helix-turn-helix transcriptional regulator [Acidimicrobiales bacterium]|nr:helix-turn-helix transcriptional regulator [Acidimicrobiales bacterium]
MPGKEPWPQLEALGQFIRSQRTLARLSLRDLAERTNVSNPYLSQIERGLHEPSVRVLRSIARALNLSAETLLAQAGLLEEADADREPAATEDAIRADPYLSDGQKEALLTVYRSYRAAGGSTTPAGPLPPGVPEHDDRPPASPPSRPAP